MSVGSALSTADINQFCPTWQSVEHSIVSDGKLNIQTIKNPL